MPPFFSLDSKSRAALHFPKNIKSCSGVEWFDVVRVVSGVLGVGVGVEETFKQVPILLGKQLEQGFPAFTQAQLLHEPVLLHLQQATIFPSTTQH